MILSWTVTYKSFGTGFLNTIPSQYFFHATRTRIVRTSLANDRRLSSWRSPPYFHRRNFRTKRFHLALFTKFVVRMNKSFELRRREANEQFNLVHYAPRIVEDAFYFVSCASRGNLSSRVYGTRVWTSRQFVDNVWPRPIEILPSSTLSRANVGRT